ncbi:myb-related transcription factor, partner of profilin [Bombina bombina]|uniref:myb-related transcription factor, partner of profilin n=1 Tax=Bombina bombina TaxID=8345 RepID=UPI00235AFC1D|nr:myb-related transcription factor, partner of profilin [Bombina bombina]
MSSGASSKRHSSRTGKTKSGRNVQFSYQQNVVLIDKIVEVYDLIFGKKARITPQSRKKALWEKISEEVSSEGPFRKSTLNCKKRYADIKRWIRTKLRKEKRSSLKHGASSGYEVNLLNYEQKLFKIIGKEIINGLGGQSNADLLHVLHNENEDTIVIKEEDEETGDTDIQQVLICSEPCSDQQSSASSLSSSIEELDYFSSVGTVPDPYCDKDDCEDFVPNSQLASEDDAHTESTQVPQLPIHRCDPPPITTDASKGVPTPQIISSSPAEDTLLANLFQSAEDYRAEQQRLGNKLNEHLRRLVAIHEEHLLIEKKTLQLLTHKLEEDSHRNDLLYALLEKVISSTSGANSPLHTDSSYDRVAITSPVLVKKESNGV